MKNNDLEYNMSNEYTPLPDEYLQGGGNVVIKNAKSKKKSLRKMLYMVTAFSFMSYSIITSDILDTSASFGNNGQSHTSENLVKPSDTPVKPSDTSDNVQIQKLPVYPIEDYTSFLTVYNDSYDIENNLENTVLANSIIFDRNIAEGYDYSMPDYKPQENFIFMGWVVYYDTDYETGPRVGMLGDALTLADMCYIKPESDGSRSIQIHAAWRYDGTSNMPFILTLDANGGSIENKTSVTYDAVGPLWSGANVYLCAYPVPVREGYTFAGWYDTPDLSQKPVSVLQSPVFFNEKVGEDGSVRIDWSSPKPLTLYAGWVKNQ